MRIRSLAITCSDLSQAPKSIKLVVNKPSLGFEDVENAQDSQVAQVIELKEDQVRHGQPIALRYVRFQSVNSLHVCWVLLSGAVLPLLKYKQIFVESNHGGGDETRIDAIDISGFPIE